MKKAKYDLDATFAYRHARAQERTVLSKFRKDSKRSVVRPKEPQPRGLGYDTHELTSFSLRRWQGGRNRNGSALRTNAGSPDGYHSARETSDFDDDTEEEAQDVESEEELMAESDNSDATSV